MGIVPILPNRVIKLFNINKYAYLVIFSALLFLLILWKVPQCQVSHFNTTVNDPIKIAELEDKFRSTIAQILGGIAILIGLYLTNKRVVATEKNLVIVEQGQITERFTRAIEHLGKDGLEFKLGGIYALERIANESKKDYWPIMEILTAYLRKNSPIQVSEKAEEPEQAYCKFKLSIDTQAVLDVFKRRKTEHECSEVRQFDLNKTYLREADLSGINLTGGNLSGADLTEADLRGAILTRADLTEADLRGAILTRANLTEAGLSGANLSGADLRGAILSGAILIGAILTRADLTQAANLSGAYLPMADLTEAGLSGANLTRANLSGAILIGANLTEANLSKTVFKDTILDGVIWGENKPDFIKDKDK